MIDLQRWMTACAVVLTLLLGSGCGVKLAYNNLDKLTRWAMSDYVDLTPEQRAYFDAEVARLLYWHRTEQLPQYAALLERISVEFTDGADLEELEAVFEEIFAWYYEIEARGVPMGVELMLSLSDEQLARLPPRLEKDNRELEEDEAGLTPAETHARWLDEFAGGFGRFSGRLNAEQIAYLESQSVDYIPQYALWADYRRRWQGAVLDLLREGREDPDAFTASFLELLEQRESVYYGEELLAIFDHNEALYARVTVWLLNHLTEEQRERFSTRTLELAITFRELTAEAPSSAPEHTVCLVRC